MRTLRWVRRMCVGWSTFKDRNRWMSRNLWVLVDNKANGTVLDASIRTKFSKGTLQLLLMYSTKAVKSMLLPVTVIGVTFSTVVDMIEAKHVS
jgi:hypothetical protein